MTTTPPTEDDDLLFIEPIEDDPYADFDDEYEEFSNFEPIQKDQKPTGSLTDNLRHHKAARDGVNKRVRTTQRRLKEYRINRDDE